MTGRLGTTLASSVAGGSASVNAVRESPDAEHEPEVVPQT